MRGSIYQACVWFFLLALCHEIDFCDSQTTPVFFSTSIFTQTAGAGHFNAAQTTDAATTTTEDPTTTTASSFVAITFKNGSNLIHVPWYLLAVALCISWVGRIEV